MFQKSESTYFDKGSIDAKSALTFEKCPLFAELKLKMSKSHQASFSILALPKSPFVNVSALFTSMDP